MSHSAIMGERDTMSKIHALQMTSHGHFNTHIHFTVPAGNNSAGVAWKDAALRAGVTGGEPYDTGDAVEMASIVAGDIVELRTTITVDPTGMEPGDITAAVDRAADAAIAAWITEQQAALQYYGYTQGTVS